MPYRYRIEPVHQLALVEIHGSVDGETCLAASRALLADPAWEPHYDVLWDLRGITRLVIGPEDMAALVEARVEEGTGRDLKVVSREIDYIALRLEAYLAQRKGKEVRVFFNFEKALAALELEQLPYPLQRWLAAAA